MEYEIFEPDPDDEYYDQMISVAYSRMFNEGREYSAAIPEDAFMDVQCAVCC